MVRETTRREGERGKEGSLSNILIVKASTTVTPRTREDRSHESLLQVEFTSSESFGIDDLMAQVCLTLPSSFLNLLSLSSPLSPLCTASFSLLSSSFFSSFNYKIVDVPLVCESIQSGDLESSPETSGKGKGRRERTQTSCLPRHRAN